MPEDVIKDVKKGMDYFRDLKKGKQPLTDKMEDAIEGTQIPKPEPEKELRDKSTKGSPPFSEAELKRGYRKVDG